MKLPQPQSAPTLSLHLAHSGGRHLDPLHQCRPPHQFWSCQLLEHPLHNWTHTPIHTCLCHAIFHSQHKDHSAPTSAHGQALRSSALTTSYLTSLLKLLANCTTAEHTLLRARSEAGYQYSKLIQESVFMVLSAEID